MVNEQLTAKFLLQKGALILADENSDDNPNDGCHMNHPTKSMISHQPPKGKKESRCFHESGGFT